jgi:hypothetical protein
MNGCYTIGLDYKGFPGYYCSLMDITGTNVRLKLLLWKSEKMETSATAREIAIFIAGEAAPLTAANVARCYI